MNIKSETRTVILLTFIICFSVLASAKKGSKPAKNGKKASVEGPALIWRDPGNIPSLDLLNGVGGAENAPPGGDYKFVSEDTHGTTPKFDILDVNGVKWRAKLGIDAQTDTAATRLLWAMGYFVTENYYVPELHVTGISKSTISRGQRFISDDGTMHRARLKLKTKGEKKEENWSWFNNPFTGTKEFNGLRVMMALINNWDLKEINNAVYVEKNGERHYMVSDVDASFARTGNYFTRTRGVEEKYAESKFVRKVTPEYVDLVMSSRPFLLSAIDVPNYLTRTKMENVAKHIPRADAKWIGGMLAQLSSQQIGDAFRAGGFSPEVVEGYTKVVQERIKELNEL